MRSLDSLGILWAVYPDCQGSGPPLATVGLVIGAIAALAPVRVLPALMTSLGKADPLVFAAVVPVLLLAALLACYLPAASATRVNPVETIAAE